MIGSRHERVTMAARKSAATMTAAMARMKRVGSTALASV
jgi:hypothetical protein